MVSCFFFGVLGLIGIDGQEGINPMSSVSDQIISRKTAAEDYLQTKRQGWDMVEKLFHNQLNDLIANSTKSQVFDPELSTLSLERSYRVMAQLATGKVKAISKNDIGTSMLMNLVLEKYIIPNANAQFDFLTKLRMVDLYSNIYGSFYTLIDWDVRKNGYIGPDMWLLNIRDVFPQVGAVSIDDSDGIIIRTWKPQSYFDNLAGQKGFKNAAKIAAILKSKTGSKDTKDARSTSQREIDQYPKGTAAKGSGYFEVLTQFERDRWVDICVDADRLEFRDQKNPHDDDDLPVKCKYSIPLIDDFMGMGDFERGATMQKAINSAWNLYFDGVKISFNPPILINKDNIASMSSLKMDPAAKWLVRNQINNSAQALNLNPQGIQTFNNVYQVAKASLLNMYGTTNTNTTQETDPGFGKTPQAIAAQTQRENTRDNADRFFMEQFVSSVMKKFVNLTAKKQSSAITLRLFETEIADLARSYPEVKDAYDEKTGKLTIDKKQTGSTLYDYEIVTGSTYAVDQKTQQQNLANLLNLFMQAQGPQGNLLVEQLKQEGWNFNFGELMKRIVSNSGIQDWDKILQEQTEGEKTDAVLQGHANQFQAALQAMQGNMNQTPVAPGQPQGQPQQLMPQQMQQQQQPIQGQPGLIG